MKIDLSISGRIDAELLPLFNEVAQEMRGDYNRIIESIGEGRENNIDWWVSELASRNTYSCCAFDLFCRFVFIERLVESGRVPTSIVTDCEALSRVLAEFFSRRRLPCCISTVRRARDCLFPVLALVRYAYYVVSLLLRWLFLRFVFPVQRDEKLSEYDVTLVDVFVFDHSFKSGRYEDRYFGGFQGVPVESNQKRVYWCTFQTSLWGLASVCRDIRRASEAFLVEEDYLSFSDYLRVFLFPMRSLFLAPRAVVYDGVNVSPIFRQAWRDHIASISSMLGLMKHALARRLKDERVRLRLVIDWFEGQIIDKGASLGLREQFPEVPIIGYVGYYTSNLYLCMFPTRCERDANVLPTRFAVCGPGIVDEFREFCPDVSVDVGPAFRFSGVWKTYHRRRNPSELAVLVALDLTLNSTRDILALAVAASVLPMPAPVTFLIKAHPGGLPVHTILERCMIDLPGNTRVVEGAFDDWLEKTDVVITNTSSTGLEALAKGVPVIIAGSACAPTRNPIPKSAGTLGWRLCFSGEEVAAFIGEVTKDPDRVWDAVRASALRERFFCPVSQETVCDFLAR